MKYRLQEEPKRKEATTLGDDSTTKASQANADPGNVVPVGELVTDGYYRNERKGLNGASE